MNNVFPKYHNQSQCYSELLYIKVTFNALFTTAADNFFSITEKIRFDISCESSADDSHEME